ncbi:MAG: hypothetical protein QM791_02905 [Ferruginibacter sp.]
MNPYISFIAIPILGIIFAGLCSLDWKHKNKAIIFTSVILTIISCWKGCCDIKLEENNHLKDSINKQQISHLQESLDTTAAILKTQIMRDSIFSVYLKDSFHIIKQDTIFNKPVFFDKGGYLTQFDFDNSYFKGISALQIGNYNTQNNFFK